MSYTAPKITELGSVREMTQRLNKIGDTPDVVTSVVPNIVGSLVPIQ